LLKVSIYWDVPCINERLSSASVVLLLSTFYILVALLELFIGSLACCLVRDYHHTMATMTALYKLQKLYKSLSIRLNDS